MRATVQMICHNLLKEAKVFLAQLLCNYPLLWFFSSHIFFFHSSLSCHHYRHHSRYGKKWCNVSCEICFMKMSTYCSHIVVNSGKACFTINVYQHQHHHDYDYQHHCQCCQFIQPFPLMASIVKIITSQMDINIIFIQSCIFSQ